MGRRARVPGSADERARVDDEPDGKSVWLEVLFLAGSGKTTVLFLST